MEFRPLCAKVRAIIVIRDACVSFERTIVRNCAIGIVAIAAVAIFVSLLRFQRQRCDFRDSPRLFREIIHSRGFAESHGSARHGVHATRVRESI